MTSNYHRVAIVGAGITGLTIAYKLQQRGVEVELFEKNGFAGGSIKTVRENGWLLEFGPNTLLVKDRPVKNFLDELGLNDVMLEANPQASKRYIVKNGALQHLPLSLVDAISNPLFSLKGKFRVLGEPFVSKSDNPDQTVAEFAERRLGREMLDYALNPFIAGIYANRPENLSLRHAFPAMHELEEDYGSLIVGALLGGKKRKKKGRIPRKLISFEEGLQQMCTRIAENISKLHYNHTVEKIRPHNDGWELTSQRGNHGPFEKVIINVPVYLWGDSLLPGGRKELEEIREVGYPPLSVMHLGFHEDQIDHPLDGFGFLVPEKEDLQILGALFSSTLFPKRAPESHVLLTVFIGGGRQPDIARKESNELLKIVKGELENLIGLRGDPILREHVYWPRSIPGYHVGYERVLESMLELESKHEGLRFAGNFRNGISVPDCIKNGLKLAEEI